MKQFIAKSLRWVGRRRYGRVAVPPTPRQDRQGRSGSLDPQSQAAGAPPVSTSHAGRKIPRWVLWGGCILLLFVAIEIVGRAYAEPGEQSRSDEYIISEVVTGLVRLGLEYGIDIDGDAAKQMLIASDTAALGMYRGVVGMLYGWIASPEELANGVKQTMLDDGLVPREEVRKIAERVEAFTERP